MRLLLLAALVTGCGSDKDTPALDLDLDSDLSSEELDAIDSSGAAVAALRGLRHRR